MPARLWFWKKRAPELPGELREALERAELEKRKQAAAAAAAAPPRIEKRLKPRIKAKSGQY